MSPGTGTTEPHPHADCRPRPWLQRLFFALVVRPLVYLWIGLRVRGREHLPSAGPAVVVSNHNSHLDTLVLMSLFPARMLHRIRPVAAADYFLVWRLRAWIACRLIGILPIARLVRGKRDPLAPLAAELDRGAVLILFPEGTRGEPERMDRFRAGIAHLAARRPDVPIVPVFLSGLGRVLPKGALVPVPFFVDVAIGEPVRFSGDRHGFARELEERVRRLGEGLHRPPLL